MKQYTEEIAIQKPLEEVTRLFAAIEHFPDWQPDLKDYITFRGDPMQDGARSRLMFSEGKHDNIKMVETVVENRLPEFIKLNYSTDGVLSHQTHSFVQNSDGTIYSVHNEYDLEGWMRVMGFLNPGHFKHQTRAFMEAFKKFVESYQ